MVDTFFVLQLRHENHLRVRTAHLLQCLQIADLHGRFGIKFFGCQSHQFCRFHVGPCGNDLAFGEATLLGGAGE